jgi:hypothetical protein
MESCGIEGGNEGVILREQSLPTTSVLNIPPTSPECLSTLQAKV